MLCMLNTTFRIKYLVRSLYRFRMVIIIVIAIFIFVDFLPRHLLLLVLLSRP